MDKEREEELSLNFDSGEGAEELRLAREELEADLAEGAFPETEDSGKFAAIPAEAQVEPTAPSPAEAQPQPEDAASAPEAEMPTGEPVEEPPEAVSAEPVGEPLPEAVSVPAEMADPDPALPRSRMPANRPAGTMPLTAAAGPMRQEIPLEGKRYGEFLREMRERRGLDYAALENATKILPRYLEALEKEDLKSLPPVVYVIAYIRTLCRFYGIGNDRSESLIRELKQELIPTCSDELLNTLEIDSSASEAHEKLLRRILWSAVGGAGLLIILIGIGIYLSRRPAAPAQPASGTAAEQFDAKRLDALLEPPTPEVTRLPVAK